MHESAVRVGLVFPELLGTYGDRGNAVVLVERCRRRGIDAELVEVTAGAPIPESIDIYLFGGGEDDPQVMEARTRPATARTSKGSGSST
jgi:lipid II isoglutaminyl synthase (glutamine-hydrolysing)